jgi:hypothetical protein
MRAIKYTSHPTEKVQIFSNIEKWTPPKIPKNNFPDFSPKEPTWR